jgi:hypothetical protein
MATADGDDDGDSGNGNDSGCGSGSVDDSAVRGRCDTLVGRGNPMTLEPLLLWVPIPVTMVVPIHQATNAYSFTFLIEATCECRFKVISPISHTVRVWDCLGGLH